MREALDIVQFRIAMAEYERDRARYDNNQVALLCAHERVEELRRLLVQLQEKLS